MNSGSVCLLLLWLGVVVTRAQRVLPQDGDQPDDPNPQSAGAITEGDDPRPPQPTGQQPPDSEFQPAVSDPWDPNRPRDPWNTNPFGNQPYVDPFGGRDQYLSEWQRRQEYERSRMQRPYGNQPWVADMYDSRTLNPTIDYSDNELNDRFGSDPDSVLIRNQGSSSVAHKLKQYLFSNEDVYDKSMRPVRNITNATHVEISLRLHRLLDIDEPRSQLHLLMEHRLRWFDQYLTWRPSEFHGISYVIVPANLVWTPDLWIMERHGNQGLVGQQVTSVKLYSDGMVEMHFTQAHELSCVIDSKWIPTDNQTCYISFISYTYETDELVMNRLWASVLHRDNTDWTVRNFTAYGFRFGDSQPVATFVLELQRDPTFYTFAFMIPSCLIVFVNIFGLFTPGEASLNRTEKMSIALLSLIALSINMTALAQMLPMSTDGWPHIGTFTFVQICLVVLQALVAVVIMFINSFSALNVAMPKCCRWLIGRSQRRRSASYLSAAIGDDEKDPKSEGSKSTGQGTRASSRASSEQLPGLMSSMLADESELNRLLRDLKILIEQLRVELLPDDIENEVDWNRLCFWLDLIALGCFFVQELVLSIIFIII